MPHIAKSPTFPTCTTRTLLRGSREQFLIIPEEWLSVLELYNNLEHTQQIMRISTIAWQRLQYLLYQACFLMVKILYTIYYINIISHVWRTSWKQHHDNYWRISGSVQGLFLQHSPNDGLSLLKLLISGSRIRSKHYSQMRCLCDNHLFCQPFQHEVTSFVHNALYMAYWLTNDWDAWEIPSPLYSKYGNAKIIPMAAGSISMQIKKFWRLSWSSGDAKSPAPVKIDTNKLCKKKVLLKSFLSADKPDL